MTNVETGPAVASRGGIRLVLKRVKQDGLAPARTRTVHEIAYG